MAVNVVWFKRDLRLSDHAALERAISLNADTLLLYILEPELVQDTHYRGRHWQFIGQSLTDMQKRCRHLATNSKSQRAMHLRY